jgi:uncharacterized membrane protein
MDRTVDQVEAGVVPLPTVRRVAANRPFAWLRLGWRDLRRAAEPSLAFGACVALFGVLLMLFAWRATYLAPALLGGFLLVAPFLATVLYALSRQIERGEAVEARAAWRSLRRNANSLALFGLVLTLALIMWERTSAIVFALFYGGQVARVETLVNDVLFSGRYATLLLAYFGIGGLLAAAVFALGVVSAPLLLDRDVDVVTAVITSVRCCLQNPMTMLLWAALIAVLTLIGFATYMVGLVLIFPLIGHATWHAYRDLVAPDAMGTAQA